MKTSEVKLAPASLRILLAHRRFLLGTYCASNSSKRVFLSQCELSCNITYITTARNRQF